MEVNLRCAGELGGGAGLVGTTVLQLSHEGARYIAKAGDEHDHHLTRGLRAHREWLDPWVREAIGTAVWAHQVGNQDFERQGHRMIAEALGL